MGILSQKRLGILSLISMMNIRWIDDEATSKKNVHSEWIAAALRIIPVMATVISQYIVRNSPIP
jgi:hypothetical protein